MEWPDCLLNCTYQSLEEGGEGYDAYVAGKEIEENPYPENTDSHLNWRMGWLEGQADDNLFDE